jgi:thiol-disulfide isomerase/thioredoxin
MKKILPIVVVGLFLLSVFGANAIQIEKTDSLKENIILNDEEISQRGTHTVLGEYGTATWCGYCKYAHGALKELYAEGQLDFYYIIYVCDMNSVASSYCSSHYNLYGYPTVWFDGGCSSC